MNKSTNPYTPKTREEFEAYCRAMDEANEAVIRSATAREQAEQAAAGQQTAPPQNDMQDQQTE